MNQEEMLIKLRDISRRRLDSFNNSISQNTNDWLKAKADATTVEDIVLVNEASEMLDEFAQTVVDLVSDFSSEYTQGYRCGVCGRTTKQSEDLGYNCAYEC